MDYLVRQVVKGFHATVFVYGQTGSGKTFTMEGYKYQEGNRKLNGSPQVIKPLLSQTLPKEEGLIPRTIRNLFE